MKSLRVRKNPSRTWWERYLKRFLLESMPFTFDPSAPVMIWESSEGVRPDTLFPSTVMSRSPTLIFPDQLADPPEQKIRK